jgi:chemotaxis protein MotB
MANADNEELRPIIIKKVKKGGHGHHGGAWKVAYADFVTAMMAFFLLMWLLAVSSEEQKNAISNYFDPTHPLVSSELSGSGGILGGMTMSPEGAQVSNVQDIAVPTTPTTPRSGMAMGDQTDQLGTSDYRGDTYDSEIDGPRPSDTDQSSSIDEDGNDLQDGMNILETLEDIQQAEIEQLEAVIEQFENEDFESIKDQILDEVEKTPELANLMDNLMIDITPEGLRIQIIDNEGRSMFPSGSANMFDFMAKLVEKVTQIIIPQTNQISVRGHTDGKPYPEGATYNNWNLSSDRALASQKAMIDKGLTVSRVENVVGKADREHLLPEEPLSPRNRRISIILLREKLKNADDIRAKAAEAIQKAADRRAAQEEDRSDIPELDQVIDGSTSFSFGESDDEVVVEEEPTIEENDDLIGSEIEAIRERQNQRRQSPALSAPPVTITDDQQVLEFP